MDKLYTYTILCIFDCFGLLGLMFGDETTIIQYIKVYYKTISTIYNLIEQKKINKLKTRSINLYFSIIYYSIVIIYIISHIIITVVQYY